MSLNVNESISLPVNYPSNLELSTTYLNNSSINFLDVNINISHNDILTFNIYDKQKAIHSCKASGFLLYMCVTCIYMNTFSYVYVCCDFRGKKIYEPPRFMTVSCASQQLVEIINNKKSNGDENLGKN